ncbi:hypothetical protein F4V89_22100 [Neorhizobium galegae]|nr:hypothetical protein F4V89_22100 [Neorhizobium galegae]
MSTPISSPRFSDVAIVGDDAFLTAMLCSRLAKQGEYLTVLEAPRMARPDVQAEVVTCNNTLARVGATRNFFAGVEIDAKNALSPYYNGTEITDASSEDVIAKIPVLHNNGNLSGAETTLALVF